MNKKLVVALVLLAFVVSAYRNKPLMNDYMTQKIHKGMTESELIEVHGSPIEVEALPSGKRISYFYGSVFIKKNFIGKIKEKTSTPMRLDIFLDSKGTVDRYETVADPESSAAQDIFMKANTANSRGDYKAALEMLDQLLEIRPHYFIARKIRASVYAVTENREKAEEDYGVILQADPGNYAVNHNRGINFLKREEPKSALESFDRALETQPDSLMTHAYRALAYYKVGENEKGAADIAYAKAGDFIFPKQLKDELNQINVDV